MNADYYDILAVNRNASEDDLKKAYDRLASIWHPDKVPSMLRKEAEVRFIQISEAFHVLSDPQKRRTYDRFCEKVMKYGKFPFPSSSYDRGKGKEVVGDNFGGESGGEGHGGYRVSAEKAADEHQLLCSLEELYSGAKKEMIISRDILDHSWNAQTIKETLTIEITPGWKKGTKITFPGKGSLELFGVPTDLVYVIDEIPHAMYKRDGDDLVVNKVITPMEALRGTILELTTLDGRNLAIPLQPNLKLGFVIFVPNEGMPCPIEPGKRGNLRINIDVAFPFRSIPQPKFVLGKFFGRTF